MVSPVWAQSDQAYWSGRDLKAYCLSDYDVDYGLCSGYITAVADLMIEHNLYGLQSCHSNLVRPQQLVDLVVTSLRKNDQTPPGNARYIVASVLAKSFPCS